MKVKEHTLTKTDDRLSLENYYRNNNASQLLKM